MLKTRLIYLTWLLWVLGLGPLRSHAQALPDTMTASDGQSWLWEIRCDSSGRTSYLLGTFHLLCREDLHLSSSLQQALSRTGELVLESDLDDPTNLMEAMRLMNMADNHTLRDWFSRRDYERLSRFFRDSLKLSLESVSRMQPALLEALLYPKLMRCRQTEGMEMALMRLAKTNGIQTTGLESLSYQAQVFQQIPYRDQARALMQHIRQFERYRQDTRDWVNLYLNSDLDGLEKSMRSEKGFEKTRDVLLDQRNRNWIKLLTPRLCRESLMIAVGAGHLTGEQGLLSLLKEKGFTLRAIRQ